MPKALFDPVSVGDQRPVAVLVNPTDGVVVESATYTITRRKDPKGYVWDPGGACVITNNNLGSQIRTPDLIDFATADYYTVNFSITWADGQIDNSVSAIIPVQSSCGC